ncbi:MAG: hypothetical protein JW913_01760 [Chitinispirillaceae bacterium]|nr:hypothetical protein [Chitinispirillaceae bacterium]
MFRFILALTFALSLLLSSCAIFICDADDPCDDDDDSITVIIHQSPIGPGR